MAAVNQYGDALEYASDGLKNDHEIVLAAVNQNGRAVAYASDELKNDHEIVMAAVNETAWALQYASDELKQDREIALIAVANNWLAQYLVAPVLRNDPLVLAEFIHFGARQLFQHNNGSPLKKLLTQVLECIPPNIVLADNAAALEYAQANECGIWHKIWLVNQMINLDAARDKILAYQGDLATEFQEAKDLLHCAPVIGAFVEMYGDRDWRNINTY